MSAAGLEASVVLRRGDLRLDVALAAAPGEVVAVMGPNGAGKTTLLRALSGLEPLEAGRVVLDGVVLDEPSAGRFVRPERRAVGVVFQEHRLFPSMSVVDNVAFGLRARRVPRGVARARAEELLALLGLAGRGGDRPAALSGGQAQRVALARALAVEPALLLLDEPLAALDAATRVSVRHDVRAVLAGFPGARVLVTHDTVDARVLADRIVVVEAARVLQAGTLAELAARPRSRYVAELVGTNVVAGQLRAGTLTTPGGSTVVTAATGGPVPAGEATVVIRPQAVTLARARPAGSARNVWPGRVVDLDVRGERVRVQLDGPVPLVAEITLAAQGELALAPGDPVWAAVKASDVEVHPSGPDLVANASQEAGDGA